MSQQRPALDLLQYLTSSRTPPGRLNIVRWPIFWPFLVFLLDVIVALPGVKAHYLGLNFLAEAELRRTGHLLAGLKKLRKPPKQCVGKWAGLG